MNFIFAKKNINFVVGEKEKERKNEKLMIVNAKMKKKKWRREQK